MFSVMLKCPSKLFVKKPDASSSHCWHVPQTEFNVRHKCTCKNLDVTSSSSSTSLTSDNFPVKLKDRSVHRDMYMPKTKHSSKRSGGHFHANPFKKLNTSCQEQFYSCNSDDSESDEKRDKLDCPRKGSKKDKNSVILKLLHEIEHLINKNPMRESERGVSQVATPSADAKSSKTKTQQSEVNEKQLCDKTTSIPQLIARVCSPHTCCCCTCRMAHTIVPPYNFPFLQPDNLAASPVYRAQILQPFVYEEADSFKDCSGENQSIATEDQTRVKSSPRICSKIPIFSCLCPAKSHSNELDLSIRTDVEEVFREDNKSQSDSLHDKLKINKLSRLLEMEEEYVDEELHPLYVDNILTEPVVLHGPTADTLMEYDDEEPVILENIEYVDEEINPFLEQVQEIDPSLMYELHSNSLMQHDDEEPSYPALPAKVSKIKEVKSAESKTDELGEHKIIDGIINDEIEKSLRTEREKVTEKSSLIKPERTEETLRLTKEERSSYIVYTSPKTGQNIYNFLPEIDKPVDTRHLITCKESDEECDYYCSDDEDYELGKEKISEICKRKAPEVFGQPAGKDMSLATLKQSERMGSTEEMKFFIDSLIMDLKAMDYSRCKSQFEKNICKTKIGLYNRNSFPVTITDVTDLGASSLYVKWKIHDCFGIGGYEIYTDGYLTNRYYNSIHDSAVITQVDVTLPHKIALVAQACNERGSLESICNMIRAKRKSKSSPCKTVVAKEPGSYSALWTPSIFLYDPITCRAANAAPPINYERQFLEEQQT